MAYVSLKTACISTDFTDKRTDINQIDTFYIFAQKVTGKTQVSFYCICDNLWSSVDKCFFSGSKLRRNY
ncbi:MAG TPA: hypothetical protein DDX85_08780 [Nitrospiraceae bacterium]|nr:hypothetical protein [Nitrospiraceae bacterium]